MNINLRVICAVFGVVFVLLGTAGFIPPLVENDLLFNTFMVGPVHNVIHLLSGGVALFAATNLRYSELFFKVFGVFYGVVALVGFFTNDLLIMHVNMADNLLHTVIAVVALFLGFFYGRRPQRQQR